MSLLKMIDPRLITPIEKWSKIYEINGYVKPIKKKNSESHKVFASNFFGEQIKIKAQRQCHGK